MKSSGAKRNNLNTSTGNEGGVGLGGSSKKSKSYLKTGPTGNLQNLNSAPHQHHHQHYNPNDDIEIHSEKHCNKTR